MDMPCVGNNFFDDLMVVLVLYEMEIHEAPAVISLTTALQSMQQRATIFIYDNSLLEHDFKLNETWITIYKQDSSNSGVSKAYNEGFKCAKAQNKKWMLLADQDTEFEKDFFLKIKEAVENNPDRKPIVPIMMDKKGIVSPFHFHFGRGLRLKRISPGEHPLGQKKFINSGLIVSTTLFEKCGGYDERFPLDFSDLAFIQRLKKCQERFIVINAICEHNLSAQEKSFSKSKDRFKYFVNASCLYGSIFGPSFFLSYNKFFRAIKLGFKFKSMEFLKMLIQNK